MSVLLVGQFDHRELAEDAKMDRNNMGYAIVKFGISIAYLCADLVYEICRMMAVIIRHRS